MNAFKVIPILLPWLVYTSCEAQGTVTFDGPPVISRGNADVVQFYSEIGMLFQSGTSDGFIRQGGGISFYPDNGTAYIQASAGDSLSFGFSSGAYFNMVSVDLAGYSTVVPDFSVEFIGTLYNGDTMSTTFSGSGINFQTFKFGPEWTGLTSVAIPNDAWSLDNLVASVGAVPEPTTWALALTAICAFTLLRNPIYRRDKRD
jgi:hypothetical protein